LKFIASELASSLLDSSSMLPSLRVWIHQSVG